ncbi:MAG TPA: PKD domain-containing protein [Anaerolineales bacterium]|nr:PKD domain-containing protein [Anaerolineales bacterium]
MKNKFSMAMSLAVILAMVFNSLALADEVYADGDGVIEVSQHPLHFGDVCADTSVSGTALLAIFRNGNINSDKVFANSSTVTISINSVTGSGLSAAMNDSSIVLPSDWVSNGSLSSDTAQATVTLDASGLPLGSYSGKIVFQADGTNAAPPPASYSDTDQMPVDANIVDCAPSNTAPAVAADNASVTVDEGDTANNTGTFSDADNDSVTLSASVGTVLDTGSGTWSWFILTIDGPADSQTVTIYADDGQAQSSTTFDLTVNNVAPTVAAPYFELTQINCLTSIMLTGISFSDPGVNDDPWHVVIDWGDGSTDTEVDAGNQGAQEDQTHQYTIAGTFTATVTVTDKDGDSDYSTSSNTITVIQYALDFLPPFDDSTPSALIVNTMKSGRTVPVKTTIYDYCAAGYVTGASGATVTIAVSKAAETTGETFDTVEVYADAGSSNSGTNVFRWSADSTVVGGGFWIYNLDSRNAYNGSALTVGQLYRINVKVNSVLATVTNWALLKPVK